MQFLSRFFSRYSVEAHAVQPGDSTDPAITWKNFRFILSLRLENLLIPVYSYLMHVVCCFKQILEAAPHKTAPLQPPTKIYIHHLCVVIGYRLGDLPRVMDIFN